MRPMFTWLGVVALIAAGLCFPAAASATATKPNVVVIQTDDQSLNTMQVMTRTQRLIGDAGLSFDRYFTSFSLCCPSRASLLTGQYAHNHGVESNMPPGGGYYALDSRSTLPVWLQRAGYVTAHVGKYLNGYVLGVPRGWNEWYTGMDPTTYRYFNYWLNENGLPRKYGRADRDYQTDVLTRKAVGFIERRARSDRPFFLSLDYLAPHEQVGGIPRVTPAQPPVPAPRHAGAMAQAELPVDPSFDEVDVSDKPAHVRNRPALTDAQREEITTQYRARLESLLAVDEGVEQVIRALEASGELDSTYVLFVSDNGWMEGQHRYPSGKRVVYEPSMHLPLLMRGPGIPSGTRTSATAANVDLAPTLLELTGAAADAEIDGRSLVPVLGAPAAGWDRDILHEFVSGSRGGGDPSFTAVRSPDDLVYVEHATGERELYDLRADPFQLDSRHDDPAYGSRRDALAERLAVLRTCRGETCR